MAISGFEGFEKRLELHFYGDDPIVHMGLRLLDIDTLEKILRAVQCTVVSAVGNHHFDAYVLSESSLFIYPTKIIIKTCGTTQLLKSVRPLLHHAHHDLGLTLSTLRYTRGNFIFPKAQPFPHTSFKEEVIYLQDTIPTNLCYRKASIMPSKKIPSHSWHVFTASLYNDYHDHDIDQYTVEICMTDLDRVAARKFFGHVNCDGKTGDSAGKDMTELAGINDINPNALICDFGFDPCGYSMNGIDDDRYSTIHVTPEDGFSYASFECMGLVYDEGKYDLGRMMKKVVNIFRPGTMSVSITCASSEIWRHLNVTGALEPLGFKCRSCIVDEFPAVGSVVFLTFKAQRK